MELLGMEAGETKSGFGRAGAAIWVMQLHYESKQRFSDALSKLFLEMSMDELRTVKYYMVNGWLLGCKQVEPVAVPKLFTPTKQAINTYIIPEKLSFGDRILEKIARAARWLGEIGGGR